jgi:hypothetical protein
VTKGFTSGKDFFLKQQNNPKHIFHFVPWTCQCVPIFPLQGKNKPYEGDYMCAFILGTASPGANINEYAR